MQVRCGRAHALDEAVVGRERREPVRPERSQQRHGVALHGVPQLRVDPGEELARGGVPGPAQVEGQLVEVVQLGGQDGADGETSDRSHGSDSTQQSVVAHPLPTTSL
ncbi:hypothetical protein D3C74_381080 [compost metagenome]